MIDLVIIGAGPIGLEAAIRAKRAGLSYKVLEKGCIVNAIAHYPTYMTFFTTSDRLEIGGHPLVTATDKPTRKEALDYYRKVVQNERLAVEQHSEVVGLFPRATSFDITTCRRGRQAAIQARKVVIATGYFDNPKLLGIPGEERANVSHYYTEAHPYFGSNVTIIGAGSSAADAALDLFRAGAKVTIVHRGADFRHSLKYWIRPNLENRVAEGSITAHFRTEVREITETEVIAVKAGRELRIPSDQTFALTGYFASPKLLEMAGVQVDRDTLAAELNESFESNAPGLYVIGSAGFGLRTSDVFIENGLVHTAKALKDIIDKLKRPVAELSRSS